MKRLAIYLFYDDKGIVREFVSYYLKELKKVCSDVWVVSNGALTELSREKLLSIGVNIFERENKGFDVWGYKTMLEKIGWEVVQGFDECILCNYTCYGPVYPFSEMFAVMAKRKCDFWGVVKHPEQSAFLLPNHKGYIYEHLMSYFVVVKKKMLKSDDFKAYWDYIPQIHSKRESTAYHETYFTKHFEDLGYISDAYVDLENYKERCYNSSIILANELLRKDRCPLVKRRAFCFPEYEALLNISMADQTVELINYIEKNTKYDIAMIWQDMLETQKMSVIRNNMHLNYVIPVEETTGFSDRKANVQYIIYIPKIIYADILNEFIVKRDDLDQFIILYSEESVGDYCKKKLSGILQANFRKIIIVSGRVTLGCMEASKKELLKAEYSCCIFNYNIVEQALRITEEDFVRYLYECTIKNRIYTQGIVSKLKENKFLGIMVPSEADFAVYFSQNITKNKKNNIKNQKIYRELEFTIPFDDGDYYNNETAFWIKRDAVVPILKKMEDEKIANILFRTHTMDLFLPYFVQQAGFYVATMIPTNMAAISINHQHFMKRKLIDSVEERSGQAFWRFLDLLNEIKKKQVETKRIFVQPDKKQIIEMPFSIGELLHMVGMYPKHKLQDLQSKRNTRKAKKNVPLYTYLRNVSVEGNRLVLYFMCGKKEINRSYVLVAGKKFYSKKILTEGQIEVAKYVRDYTGAYVAFYEIPLKDVENQLICLYTENDEKVYFKWAAGISYNALELSGYGLYSRLTQEGYLIQRRQEYISGVLKSKEYSIRDKMLFVMMSLNNFHPITIMSENLSGADNTFELYKFCIEKKEDVYFLVSKKAYDSEKNKKYKKRMVVFNGKKHHFLMAFSKRWITSFSLRGELFPSTDFYKDIHYNMLPADWIFIPHGMAVGDKIVGMLYKYPWDNPKMTFANSKAESIAYAEMYDFQNVTCLGSPRMDKWKNVKINDKEICIFFTWRLGLSKGRKSFYSSFEESDYYKTIVEIIENTRKKFPDYIINYVFHHEIVKMGYDIILEDKLGKYNVNFIHLNSITGAEEFNKRFGSSKYLITDFSSVAYDFSYKKEGIAIYYLEEEFIKYHYLLEDRFFDIQLGVVTRNINELMNALELQHPTSNMRKRREKFFYSNDAGNTERVHAAIFNGEIDPKLLNQPVKKATLSNKKRLGIYFFYDEQGIVDQYVLFYLAELKKCCTELCVVVNGFLQEESEERLQQYSDKLIIRKNIGFDSWAYREAIESYGYDYIAEQFDEVILNNFTNFGPIYPFEELFDVMDKKECDFWGHNRYHAESGQKLEDVPMVDHLQSYFTVFRKSILTSSYFKKYWKTLQCPKKYVEAVKFHEIRYTKFFEELGFISEEFIPREVYSEICNNAPMYMAYSQLTKYKSPLLKRKIFFLIDGKFGFPLREEETVYDLIEYIKNETGYDSDLIYENIARTQNLNIETSEKEVESFEKSFLEQKEKAENEKQMRQAYAVKNQIYKRKRLLNSFGKDSGNK